MASIPAVKALPTGTADPPPQTPATTTPPVADPNPTSPPPPPSCLADFSQANPSCQLWADTLEASSSPELIAESWLANPPPWLTALTETPDLPPPPPPESDTFSPFISFRKKPKHDNCWEALGVCYQKYVWCRNRYIYCMSGLSSNPPAMIYRYCGLAGEHCGWTMGW
ncbi:hypothetical protein LTR70_007332 [Exophiala xenobiotica]|uniref:Uncharacterized protein n=1 Tax=Lithohypha guttulata TaxID=1690604 RepID=A0ABR0K503_9EURO|nr:hypothetical protein LTR24_007102 [Lithohypha guttulata]KAK5314121.1 hypothetical protein LTR70_007332 [Exophiala xenobiotica]